MCQGGAGSIVKGPVVQEGSVLHINNEQPAAGKPARSLSRIPFYALRFHPSPSFLSTVHWSLCHARHLSSPSSCTPLHPWASRGVQDRILSLDLKKFHPLTDRLLPPPSPPPFSTHPTHTRTRPPGHTHTLPPVLLLLPFLFPITMTPKPKRPHSPDEDSLDKPSLPPSSGVTRGSSKARKRSKMDGASVWIISGYCSSPNSQDPANISLQTSGKNKSLPQVQTDTQSFAAGTSSSHEKNAYKMNSVRCICFFFLVTVSFLLFYFFPLPTCPLGHDKPR